MNEQDLLKKVLEEHLADKEDIRRRVINTAGANTGKGVILMKKKLAVSIASVAVLAAVSLSAYAAADIYEYNQADSFLGQIGIQASSLSRGDAKAVYHDIRSNAFANETTREVLQKEATEIGLANIPENAKDIYDTIVAYNALTYTGKITSDQIRAIKAGTSYGDIVKALGSTKDIGSGRHVLQYAVDGDKVFLLSFGSESEICTKSGEELLKTLIDAKQNGTDDNTFNGTLTQRSGNFLLVSCPTFKNFDIISLTVTDATVIRFEDGSKATLDDMKGGSKLMVTLTGGLRESYPPQGDAAKIIIQK